MAKYKNITNLKVIIVYEGDLLSIQPGEVVTLKYCSVSNNILSEVVENNPTTTAPKQKDLSEELEDSIVLVSDAIVEELTKEKEGKPKSSKRRSN